MCSPFKHHVLEQVREAGAAPFFGAGADVVDNVDGHDGQDIVLREDDAETVVELVFLDRNVNFGRGGGREGGCQ
jgi:hypothetical protein